jgi:hypothetical protein
MEKWPLGVGSALPLPLTASLSSALCGVGPCGSGRTKDSVLAMEASKQVNESPAELATR